MEGHPIPQDITGFQFKLIGDMTIKQFAYVALGAVVAWIFYSLPLPGIIKLPIVAFFAILGAGVAFLPIGGRPMDTMVINFIKALFSPSQFIYQKTGGQVFATVPNASQAAAPTGFSQIQQQPKTPVDKKEMVFFSSLFHSNQNNFQSPSPTHIISSTIVGGQNKPEENLAATPEENSEEEKEKQEYLEKEEQELKKELQVAKTQESEAINTPTSGQMHEKVLELEKLLRETAAQRLELERQILELEKRLNNQTQPAPAAVSGQKKETKNVRSIPPGMEQKVGVPTVPEFPNLLTGIVKDPRGNPIPNILVEVKDKDGNPARTLKTNGLGQFAAATALANGTYNIVFEDPRGQNKFDTIEINATGDIIYPIEVISQDQREELRKALFSF